MGPEPSFPIAPKTELLMPYRDKWEKLRSIW